MELHPRSVFEGKATDDISILPMDPNMMEVVKNLSLAHLVISQALAQYVKLCSEPLVVVKKK